MLQQMMKLGLPAEGKASGSGWPQQVHRYTFLAEDLLQLRSLCAFSDGINFLFSDIWEAVETPFSEKEQLFCVPVHSSIASRSLQEHPPHCGVSSRARFRCRLCIHSELVMRASCLLQEATVSCNFLPSGCLLQCSHSQ